MMRAVLLAAGRGSRLAPLTDDVPKPLVPVNGSSIVERALNGLFVARFSEVLIVVGYKADVMRQRIGSSYAGLKIEYVLNPDWETTNSMYSLYLALNSCTAHSVIEGDVVFDPSILTMPARSSISWLIDSTYRATDGAYLRRDQTGYAVELQLAKRPELLDSAWAKSVGILQLTNAGSFLLKDWLRLAVSAGQQKLYYDLIVARHFNERIVATVDVAPARWHEIDTPEDLEIARRLFP